MAKPWVNVVQLNKVIDEECCDGALKVNIQLPESDVEDCEGNVTTVEALPTAPQGVQKVQICNPQSDAMLTCVQENANIYFIDYENDSDTYKVFDFQGNDVTGTVTPVKCEDIELTADKEPVCDNGANLWEHTIYKNGIADDVYYTAMGSTTPIIPSGPVTPGKCEIPATIKTITKTVDCSGTTADVDTTKTVEAVIDQTLDVKQCNKLESLSEYPVCAAGVTLIKKTTLDSEGTEIETFYGDNGTVVATPTAYEIGACVVEIPGVDISFTPGCSDIDGRAIVTRVSTNKITNVDTITLLEADHVTPVTDGSVMVNCSGADYEEVSVSCRENTAGDRFTVTTYIDPTDPTDVKKVWVDENGDVVPEPTGTTPCESTCEADMAYESCFKTPAGTVKVRGYFVKDSNYNEDFKTGFVISDDNLTYKQGTDVTGEAWLVTDSIVDCKNSDCEITKLYQTTVGETGINYKAWSKAGNGTTTGPVSSIFTGFDGHINGPADFEGVLAITNYSITDSQIDPSMTGEDQTVYEAWVVFEEDGLLSDLNGNIVERGALWIDDVKVFERFDQTSSGDNGLFTNFPVTKGIHKIGFQISDALGNSGVALRVSYDNGASYIPVTAYSTKPTTECIKVSICDDVIKNLVTGEVIEFDSEIHSWCKDCCENNTAQTIYERKTTHERTTGTNTYTPPFKSFSVTSFSNDVTLNSQAIPRDFTVSIDTSENEIHVTEQIVSGTDYFVTYVI